MKVKYLFVCLVIVTIVSVFTLGAHLYKKAHASEIKPLPPSLNFQLPTVGPVRNLRFTLFKEGIRPNEMRIKAGSVNILFEDKTYVAEGLRVDRVVEGGPVALGVVSPYCWRVRTVRRKPTHEQSSTCGGTIRFGTPLC
jgi:hypothetical protein